MPMIKIAMPFEHSIAYGDSYMKQNDMVTKIIRNIRVSLNNYSEKHSTCTSINAWGIMSIWAITTLHAVMALVSEADESGDKMDWWWWWDNSPNTSWKSLFQNLLIALGLDSTTPSTTRGHSPIILFSQGNHILLHNMPPELMAAEPLSLSNSSFLMGRGWS